jgi:hypothetical protein
MLAPSATRFPLSGTARERFLSATADFFLKTAQWPTVSDVERILEGRGDRLDASREAKRLCGSLGGLHGGYIVLTVRGLHLVKPKNPVLLGFKAGLDLALEHFQSGDWTTDPTLSIDELRKRASLNRKQGECVMVLMASEGLVLPADDGSTATIVAHVRAFRSVETIPEYIGRRRGPDRRRCVGQIAKRRAGLLRQKWVSRVLLSAAGILLATLVLWLGNLLLPSGGDEPPEDRPVPSDSRAPQAPSDEETAEPQRKPALYSRRSAAARSGG